MLQSITSDQSMKHVISCPLNDYKQWHRRGSIIFCSTSNSHMSYKWKTGVGEGKRMFKTSILFLLLSQQLFPSFSLIHPQRLFSFSK